TSFVPAAQGKGRFDLTGVAAGVLYLAETPEHAVAEMVQHYRGQRLDDSDLRVAGHRLALVSVTLDAAVRDGVADLCDPAALLGLGVRPDETASRDRRVTQRIAASVHAAGHTGLRWWSALSGDWHTVVLFRDRLDPPPAYAPPEPLTLTTPALREAARSLGIALAVR
ncbi:MAG TPA: RES family NAD+ phosphorylase, partial [Longimicrobiaceae bacterium]|nr:RES family NAD+ phosphorylase [Longimicrobiaceae bacterium]